MSKRPEVGGETTAYCTHCKAMHDHVIVALVDNKPAKVECDACHRQHLYRPGPPGTAVKAPKAPKAPGRRTKAAADEPPPTAAIELAVMLANKPARTYRPADRYAVGEVVEHPSFGRGLVTRLPAAQKMECHFPDGPKLLLHDRGSAPQASLGSPPKRGDVLSGTSDAPPRSRR